MEVTEDLLITLHRPLLRLQKRPSSAAPGALVADYSGPRESSRGPLGRVCNALEVLVGGSKGHYRKLAGIFSRSLLTMLSVFNPNAIIETKVNFQFSSAYVCFLCFLFKILMLILILVNIA